MRHHLCRGLRFFFFLSLCRTRNPSRFFSKTWGILWYHKHAQSVAYFVFLLFATRLFSPLLKNLSRILSKLTVQHANACRGRR